jgi:hypothetical protein
MTFDEVCRRAAGRRAYNRQRRRARQRRISQLITLLAADSTIPNRTLAAACKVHESTISRDLKFIRRVKREYRRMSGCELRPRSFRWLPRGWGYEITFEWRAGVRVR